MANRRRKRRNLVKSVAEFWRPPLFHNDSSLLQTLVATLRRFFDLQAGSIWKDLKEELSTASGAVLDVGCGAQPYRSLLPDRVHYIGIDTADAKAWFGYESPDTIYFAGDILPVDEATADLVLCAEVMEHVIDPSRLLLEINRCLKPGGRILIVVPFSARWHFIPYDYYRYTPSGLKYLLDKAGFTDICIFARGNPLTVACYKVMALMLPLMFSQSSHVVIGVMSRILGFLTLPFLFVLACTANLTLRMDWGEDCLGYTVTAKPKKDN